MATRTSTQSGNWSNASTWGGTAPVAGDTVIVASPHIVTIDNVFSTIYGPITVNSGGSLIHQSGIDTQIICANFLTVNGKYEMVPRSTLLFQATSKTSSTAGQAAGLVASGSVSNCQLIMNGSLANPETYLTTEVDPGDNVLLVNNITGFAAGEYISVYYDASGQSSWTWTDSNFHSDEVFIINHISSNGIYIRRMVGAYATLTENISIDQNYAVVDECRRFQPGMKLFIENDSYTVSSIDESLSRVIFTDGSEHDHDAGVSLYEAGAYKNHVNGSKVYKLCSVLTADAASGQPTITVADATMWEIGDRLAIEGNARNATSVFEGVIQSKAGNQITFTTNLTGTVYSNYIVAKTNRDCIVTTTNPNDDNNRFFIYYISGGSSVTGRKLVMRNVEFSHLGNSGSTYYTGLCFRGDFSNSSNEVEMNKCVVRDGWNTYYNGIFPYSMHYGIGVRNSVVYHTFSSVSSLSSQGTMVSGIVGIGLYSTGIRVESNYYSSKIHNCINVNMGTYGIALYATGEGKFTYSDLLFRHVPNPIYTDMMTKTSQEGILRRWVFEDFAYRQSYTYGGMYTFIDIYKDLSKSPGVVNTGWSSDYSNPFNHGDTTTRHVFLDLNGIKGYFEIYTAGGWMEKDTSVHNGNGWSYKAILNYNGRPLNLTQRMLVYPGTTYTVKAYMRKSSSYNGSFRPRLHALGMESNGMLSLLQTQEMDNVNDLWTPVTLIFTPTIKDYVGFGFSGVSGSTIGGIFWVDPRIVVVTDDKNLAIAYGLNLKFGLEESGQDNYSVLLGGGITL